MAPVFKWMCIQQFASYVHELLGSVSRCYGSDTFALDSLSDESPQELVAVVTANGGTVAVNLECVAV